MSKPQLDLIRRCIQEDFVEVGLLVNRVSPKTAESLVDAEILEYDWPNDCENTRLVFVRLCTRQDQ